MDNDLISRQAIKEKLQEHRDFFVNAYNGFENMPSNIKLRVDEITNCIAEVVNIPAVQPEQKTATFYVDSEGYERCSACKEHESGMRYFNFCPNCGAKMESEVT